MHIRIAKVSVQQPTGHTSKPPLVESCPRVDALEQQQGANTNKTSRPTDKLDLLFYAFLDAEPDSADNLVSVVQPLVLRRLRYEFTSLDQSLLTDAAHDALITLLRNPTAYSPRLSRLDVYLSRLAAWRVRNAIRRQRRLGVRERQCDREDLLRASIAADLQYARSAAVTEYLRARLLSVARSPAEERIMHRLLDDADHHLSKHPAVVRVRDRWRKRSRRSLG